MAKTDIFEHPRNLPYGENLYWRSGTPPNCKDASDAWWVAVNESEFCIPSESPRCSTTCVLESFLTQKFSIHPLKGTTRFRSTPTRTHRSARLPVISRRWSGRRARTLAALPPSQREPDECTLLATIGLEEMFWANLRTTFRTLATGSNADRPGNNEDISVKKFKHTAKQTEQEFIIFLNLNKSQTNGVAPLGRPAKQSAS